MFDNNPESNAPTGSPEATSSEQAPLPTWQFRLQSFCTEAGLRRPIYNEVSDRRGGRTAWSTVVDVEGTHYTARFWYDGKFQNNAREDAAEVALGYLTGNVVRQRKGTSMKDNLAQTKRLEPLFLAQELSLIVKRKRLMQYSTRRTGPSTPARTPTRQLLHLQPSLP